MSKAGSPPSSSSEFKYDSISRRSIIREEVDGQVESEKLYWWLGGSIVCERDSLQTGFPITKHYFGQGVLQTASLGGSGSTKLFYTTDHLGSVRQLVDENGEVVADYRYTIYGERTKVCGDLDSDFGFAGLFHHEPSGLDLATYRLYDAQQRRFISRDPLGEGVDYNLYRYTGNNPVNFVDPEGLLQRDANGNVIFIPWGDPRPFEHSNGTISTGQDGFVLADDGETAIKVVKNIGDEPGMNTNCHGYSFTDGEFWVSPYEVSKLLWAEGYQKVSNPVTDDIVVYHDTQKGVSTHSARIFNGPPGIGLAVGIEGDGINPRLGPILPGITNTHAPTSSNNLIITYWRKQ